MASVDLDEEQRDAVAAQGNLMVVACPGSGKTRMIAVRGARLLHSGPGQLCAVSFTKDSAKELLERIISEAGDDVAPRVMAGTFHSICLKQLQAAVKSGSIKGDAMRLAGFSEQVSAVTHAMNVCGVEGRTDDFIETIATAKTLDGRSPDKSIAALVDAYDKVLAKAGAMDFADMLQRCVRGMRSGKVKRLDVRWLLVDESQDLDEIQHAWVSCHAGSGVQTTLVGDDDQCHPRGVLIERAQDSVRIEEIEVGHDLVGMRSSSRSEAGLSLRSVAVSVRRTSVRPYKGPMISIEAGGHSVPVTPNHRMLVRYRVCDELHGVMLVMNKAGGCVLIAVKLCGGGRVYTAPSEAIRAASGDWCWLIETATTSEQVAARAQALGWQYGIQVIRFKRNCKIALVSSDDSDLRARALARCVELLRSVGLDEADPLIGPETAGQKRGVKHGFVINAVNVIPYAFEVVVQEAGEFVWQAVNACNRTAFEGDVYSLDVGGNGLYVGNGIVVHNSIYEWRNASGYAGMLAFKNHHNAESVVLRRCYRCAPEILGRAAKVIVRNKVRQDKALISMAREGGSVVVNTYADRAHELAAVGTMVADHPTSWGILARTNNLLRLMSGELASRGIPYSLASGDSLWEAPAVVALLDLLSALLHDDAGKMSHALVHSGALRIEQMGGLMQEGTTSAGGLVQQTNEALASGRFGVLDRERRRKIGDVSKSWAGWQRLARGSGSDVRVVISAARHWLDGKSVGDNERTALSIATDILSGYEGPLSGRLSAATRALRKDKKGGVAEGVRLMTLHGSKGLEFPSVWIIGCEDGMIPMTQGIPDEERRLMYVGMTRAKKDLVMSWSMAGEKTEPSRYFQEAGLIVKA